MTISAEYGLISQDDYFKKIVASSNLETYYLIEKGEFAYNRSYSKNYKYGTIKRLDLYDKGVVSPIYICFKSDKNICSNYLMHYFESNKWNKYAASVCTEGARNHGLLNIQTQDFFNMPIPQPALSEQEKIGNFFIKLDSLINLQENKIILLNKYKEGLINSFFDKKIKTYKTMKLNSILCEYIEKATKNDIYPHVSLTKDGIIPKGERYNRDFLVKDLNKEYKVTHYNDICYNPANLKFGVISRNKFGDAIFSPIYITFKVKYGYDPIFIEYLVTRKSFINKAIRFQEGTVYERMAVKSDDLLNLEVQIPSLEEQNKIANILSAYDNLIDKEKQILNLLQEMKSGLLQQMFI